MGKKIEMKYKKKKRSVKILDHQRDQGFFSLLFLFLVYKTYDSTSSEHATTIYTIFHKISCNHFNGHMTAHVWIASCEIKIYHDRTKLMKNVINEAFEVTYAKFMNKCENWDILREYFQNSWGKCKN